jgi:hypothetical protein
MINRRSILAPFVSPIVLAISAAVFTLTACASALPARPVADLKDIAGRWAGFGGYTGASGRTELTIREDGTGEFFLPDVEGGTRVPALLRVDKGKVLSETATATGTITLHEGKGKRILQGATIRKDRTRTGWFELMPAK